MNAFTIPLIGSCAVMLLTANIASARIVSFYLTGTNQTNCITIKAYETVKLLSLGHAPYRDTQGFVDIVRESRRVNIFYSSATISGGFSSTAGGPVLSGPLDIIFYSNDYPPGGTNPGLVWLTLEILPETYAVDKSITVGPGPGGAIVSLESSTNLLEWTRISTGVYTNIPEAKFFRISAERIPCQ